MKRIILTAVLILIANYSFGQSGSFEALKEQTNVNIIVDFSQADIIGYNEGNFSKIESDWYKDKPTIINRFVTGATNVLNKYYTFSTDDSEPYTIRVIIKSISKMYKYTFCYQLEDKNTNVLATSPDYETEPQVGVGTKLSYIKAGAFDAGKVFGLKFKKAMKKNGYLK